ncbi:polyadenylate-binding protein RBP47-like isoform X2 [Macadamia integrifolia]|uniref:polyadenylate-binding protein RBP47-like isoform X2 n=1 Tax=Macadamia integrifolia TaxID=60698 RepID=UPI001C500842|nr:polyadenylate-binding protein RBP47-like isoform X2 [Macadamia integrifolia]
MMQSSNGADPQHQQQQQPQQHHQQQQQWMAMQYPAATMVMQHQMMPPAYPQHYMPYHHQQQPTQQQQQQQHGSAEENKTIWVGDLHYWMDENYLNNCFGHTGEVISIKVIRNKQTGQSEGYGFVEFFSRAAAEKVLQSYNGTTMPNTEQPFRLNWASFSTGERRTDAGSDCSIFVGDLASDVTDTLLQETFSSRYPSVKGAKVVIDANTGRTKGYGFVRFGDESERSRAISEMNGVYCSSRAMRVGVATPRKSSAYQQQYSSQGGYASNGASAQGLQSDGDSGNTTIFVGGLDSSVTDEDLRQAFSQYGEIASVKIPLGKGCGFVQFANRSHAEEALQRLNGTVIGKQTVRLSWGRNPANKQMRADPSSQWNSAYYGGQMYDGYGGYAAVPPQDPTMYAAAATAAAYGAYPVYGNQPQVS